MCLNSSSCSFLEDQCSIRALRKHQGHALAHWGRLTANGLCTHDLKQLTQLTQFKLTQTQRQFCLWVCECMCTCVCSCKSFNTPVLLLLIIMSTLQYLLQLYGNSQDTNDKCIRWYEYAFQPIMQLGTLSFKIMSYNFLVHANSILNEKYSNHRIRQTSKPIPDHLTSSRRRTTTKITF